MKKFVEMLLVFSYNFYLRKLDKNRLFSLFEKNDSLINMGSKWTEQFFSIFFYKGDHW